MHTNTNSCGMFTFAILIYLSVVLAEGKRIDGNHQKLAIPAVFVKAGGKDKVRHDGGSPRMAHWILMRHVRIGCNSGIRSKFYEVCSTNKCTLFAGHDRNSR